MTYYEAMYILDPEKTDDDIEPAIEKYKKVVTDAGGEVTEAAKWEKGRRALAYPISKKKEGIYILMYFQAGSEVPKELDRIFRINDEVVRHLIIAHAQDPAKVKAAEAAARAEAQNRPPRQAPPPEPPPPTDYDTDDVIDAEDEAEP